MKDMKTLTVNGVNFDITDDGAVRFDEGQTLTEEQKAQARENIGLYDHPSANADCFMITDDGMMALKPEYRGACPANRSNYTYAISDNGLEAAGSKNGELPKYLVLPDIVNEQVVLSLAPAAFLYNLAIESVTLPDTITEIPERCFDNCRALKNVYNTGNIKVIGKTAFQYVPAEKLTFPNLEQLGGAGAFNTCGRLVYADVGKVESLPSQTFNRCTSLNMVASANEITAVEAKGLYLTPNLKHADFISGLTNIGAAAFLRSGVDYDWSTLSGCTFGTNATTLQYNPTDFWTGVEFTPCENRLPTQLAQNDPRWADQEGYGTEGCSWMCAMHIYCGLHNLAFSTAYEFDDYVQETLGFDRLSITNSASGFIDGLGLTGVQYTSFNANSLKALYDALSEGKYAIVSMDEPGYVASGGHAVVVYGINSKGELLVIDSDCTRKDTYEPVKYSLPIQKLCAPNPAPQSDYRLLIVSL